MMNAPQHLDLTAMIEAHMQRTGLAPTRFGELAAGDPNLVRDLKNGRELRRRTVTRIMDFIVSGRTYAETKAEAQ